MSRGILIALLVGLSVLGLVDSLYLSEKAATDSALFCDIGAGLDGCNVVAQSPYSQFLGIPLAYFGVVFYALMLIAILFVHSKPLRLSYQVLMTVAIAGALFSLVFLFIQLALIKAICMYCVVSAAVTFLSLWFSWRLFSRFAPTLPIVIP